MEPFVLLYLLYLAKLGGQLSIRFIALAHPDSVVITYLATSVGVLAVTPTFHTIVHMYKSEILSETNLTAYLCFSFVLAIIWYSPLHRTSNLPSFVLVTVLDALVLALFLLAIYLRRRRTHRADNHTSELGDEERMAFIASQRRDDIAIPAPGPPAGSLLGARTTILTDNRHSEGFGSGDQGSDGTSSSTSPVTAIQSDQYGDRRLQSSVRAGGHDDTRHEGRVDRTHIASDQIVPRSPALEPDDFLATQLSYIYQDEDLNAPQPRLGSVAFLRVEHPREEHPALRSSRISPHASRGSASVAASVVNVSREGSIV